MGAAKKWLSGLGVSLLAAATAADSGPAVEPLPSPPVPALDYASLDRGHDDVQGEHLPFKLASSSSPQQEDALGSHDERAPSHDRGMFDKGTWSLQLYGSAYDDFDNSDVALLQGTVGVGYYFADNWALDVQVSGYDLEQHGDGSGSAGSFGLNLRTHFLVRDPFSLYADAGAGVFLADRRFPEGGTNTSFTLQGGLGATYRLTDTLHLVGGARWFHVSNARRRGRDRNPHTDGTAVYLGVMFTW